jgi:hypothetical protein
VYLIPRRCENGLAEVASRLNIVLEAISYLYSLMNSFQLMDGREDSQQHRMTLGFVMVLAEH